MEGPQKLGKGHGPVGRAEEPPKTPFVFLIGEAEGLRAALRGSWHYINHSLNM